MADEVNHPTHYNSHPSGVECITITEHMSFNVGNAVKYLWRAGLKIKDTGSLLESFNRERAKMEDMQKAVWYIQREIKRLTKAQAHGKNLSKTATEKRRK